MKKIILGAILLFSVIESNAQVSKTKLEKPEKEISVGLFGIEYASASIYKDYVILSFGTANQFDDDQSLILSKEDYKSIGEAMTTGGGDNNDVVNITDQAGQKAVIKSGSGMGYKKELLFLFKDGSFYTIRNYSNSIAKKGMNKLFDIKK